MSRLEIDEHFRKINSLVEEINASIPGDLAFPSTQLRADLAGLLVVAIAATYETCVKEIIYNYANGHNEIFGGFTQRNYARLNSRIRVTDLQRYCELFGSTNKSAFRDKLKSKRKSIIQRVGVDIEKSFDQILDWRHDFAHSWNRNTTIEEAVKTHTYAKRVIYCFDHALRCDKQSDHLI